MNAPRIPFAFVALLLLAACDKLPQSKRVQTTSEIEMDLLVVRLSDKRAMALIPQLRDRKRAADATKEVLKLVTDGEATLIGWPVLTTKSGQRAVVEQIDEFRYATEFDPAGSAKVVETHPTEPGVAAPPVVPVAPHTEPPVQPKDASTITTDTVNEASPTAFETRNIGVTFEVEPNIDPNGRTIDINMVPQHVRLRGMRKVTVERPKERTSVVVEQPEFVTHKVTTSISMEDGDYALIGVFNVADMPGQMEFFILHSRIKRIEVPSSEVPPGATPLMIGPQGAADLGGQ